MTPKESQVKNLKGGRDLRKERIKKRIQIACTSHDGTSSFSTFLLPEKQAIADSSTKVHGNSVQYRNGTNVLTKRGAQLSSVSQRQGLNEFRRFLE